MSKVAKVAISLPENILEVIEKERKAKGESRSQFFRRAVEALLRQQREHEAAEQYVRGYKLTPETDDEIQAAHRAAVAVLAEEPWE
ncbi:MAG: ribbon-helix-helix protein, CopG family [Dehalococcoidia bacterium]|nr:ribbon-helix-helix protein, CopG family [Dehalococcoidia bacterium]